MTWEQLRCSDGSIAGLEPRDEMAKKKTFEKDQRLEVQPETGEAWVGAKYVEPWTQRGWHVVELDVPRKTFLPIGAGEYRDITRKVVHSQRIRLPKGQS